MSIITYTTDFGLRDGSVAIMKGVLLNMVPTAQVVDISHLIRPQDIFEGMLIVANTTITFPPNSIHVIVIDPGVGTERKPIAAKIGQHFYVCPDNGILTLVVKHALEKKWPMEFIHLNNKRYWLPEISSVFHGRDIFTPVAGHLAKSVPLKKFGTPINEIILLEFPEPKIHSNKIAGEVVFIDTFGNIVTNIPSNILLKFKAHKIQVGNLKINKLISTFGKKSPGETIALPGGSNTLVISVVNGNAAITHKVSIGMPCLVTLAH